MNLNELWISIKGAAELTGVHRVTLERRAKNKYITRQVPGAQAGKLRTEVRADSLPLDAQKKILEHYLKQSPGAEPPPAPPCQPGPLQPSPSNAIENCTPEAAQAWYNEQTPEHKAVVDQRLETVCEIRDALEATPYSERTETIKTLCAEKNISTGTFYRWFNAYETANLKGLACGRFGSSRSKLTHEQRQYLIQLIHQNPNRRAERLWEYLRHRWPKHNIGGSTIRRFLSTWKKQNGQLLGFLQDPDKWKSDYMVSFGSESDKALYFGHYWELDSSPADLLCADGRRYNLVGLIDIFSRKVKVVVSETSNSHAIAGVLRSAILDWGLPTNIVIDNGKDFTSKHINLICESLSIDQKVVTPFSPEKKPHVERFFRTLSTSLFEELEGYIGHSVAERKSIESRKSFAQRFMGDKEIQVNIEPAQLQEIIDRWVNQVYHYKRHGGIRTAPELKAAQSTEALRTILNERALDVLLQPAGLRVVGKKGIQFEGGLYIDPALVPYIKEQVQVRIDGQSAAKLFVFDLSGEYLCTAMDAALADMTAAEYRSLRKQQRRDMQEKKKAIETLTHNPMLDLIGEKEQSNNVHALQRKKPVRLEALNQAAAAALEAEGKKPQRYKSIAEQMAEQHGEMFESDFDDDDDSLDFLDHVAINE